MTSVHRAASAGTCGCGWLAGCDLCHFETRLRFEVGCEEVADVLSGSGETCSDGCCYASYKLLQLLHYNYLLLHL